MSSQDVSLAKIFDGWEGYNASIVHAIQPLTPEQMAWRPTPKHCSVGEVASHIAIGRVGWFARMDAPGSADLAQKADAYASEYDIANDKAELLSWMDASWRMIAGTLNQWTVADLSRTFRQPYGGQVYAASYQWTIWRVLTHDVHHGGELALMLGMQGIALPELGDQFGHLTMPPLAD